MTIWTTMNDSDFDMTDPANRTVSIAVVKQADSFVWTTPSGLVLALSGTGFTFSGNTPTGGTATSFVIRDGATDIVMVGGFSVAMADLFGNGMADFFPVMMDGDSLFDGGPGNEVFVSSRGNDTVYANAGNDTFIWSGRDGALGAGETADADVFYGEGGDDTLVLRPIDGDAALFGDGDLVRYQDRNSPDAHDRVSARDVETVKIQSDGGNTGMSVNIIGGLESLINNLIVEGDDGSDVINASFTDMDMFVQTKGGNDIIHTGRKSDTIDAGSGNDLINGHRGTDTINAGSGDDTIFWNEFGTDPGGNTVEEGGNDTIDGGAGADKVELTYGGTTNVVGVTSDGAGNAVFDKTFGATVSVKRVEAAEVRKTADGSVDLTVDDLTGTALRLGYFTVDFESGGHSGDDTVDATAFRGTVDLAGGRGDDTLTGGRGNDIISGGIGDDTLNGGDGNDVLIGGDGGDLIDGGAGFDTLVYADAAARVLISLSLGFGSGDVASGDLISNVEGVIGTRFNDILIGNDADNRLEGGQGRDTLYGGDGNDNLFGATEDDRLIGNAGTDNLVGGAGDDELEGGENGDTLNGGAGSDTASYSGSAAGVNVQLQYGVAAGGDAAGDTLVSIENLEGSANNDKLFGNAQDNVIRGGGGNDQLKGLNGADEIYGDSGDDWLYVDNLDTVVEGGTGTDRMVVVNGNGVTNAVGANGIEIATGNTGDDTFDGTGATASLTLSGLSGDDVLTGGDRDDYLYGDAGADELRGGGGLDRLFIDEFDTVTDGGAGDQDRVIVQQLATATVGVSVDMAASHVEIAFGNRNDDTFDGSSSTDDLALYGRQGQDTLIGGSGNDRLFGDNNDTAAGDVLNGGKGNDFLLGGENGAGGFAERDQFVFDAEWGNDRIFDFADNGAEKIDFSSVAGIDERSDLSFSDVSDASGSYALISYADAAGWTGTIRVYDVTSAELQNNDFIFA